MRKTIGILTAASLMLALVSIGLVATAAENGNVCPEEGKVESTVDGDIDNIVLDAGTQVCIFGANVQVNVTADGQSTLFELLGLGKNVSHYTITEVPPSTTTTTEVPTTSTTTVPESTTTTSPPETTTTTIPESTTTTVTSTTSTTEVTPSTSTTTLPSPSTTTTPVTLSELPFTGANDVLNWALFGVALVILGGTLMWFAAQEDD